MNSSPRTFTYWSLLGLSPSSTSDELKQAFIREAKRWHPDLNRDNRNAEERFKWVNESYKVLSDPRKRFEWETAGRPTFKIEEKETNPQTEFVNKTKIESSNIDVGFSSAEKLLLVIIATFSLAILNAFSS